MKIRQPKQRQLGAKGQTAAKLFFESLGWGVIESNGDHDLGTDLLVQIRDQEFTDLSLMFGVQVKTGDSWFKKQSRDKDRPGWVFREKDQKHANYWSNHPLPHILLIQSDDLTRRYWVLLNRETIEPTKKGFKVVVPSCQPLDEQSRIQWEEATTQALKRVALDGARWSFKLDSIPTPAHARYALLASDLVAPHPNRGDKEPISWPEAVAMCISSGAERWEQSADSHATVPAIADAREDPEWGWRFAAAVHSWVYGADPTPLQGLDSSQQPRQIRIAHAVATAVALGDHGRLDEARECFEGLELEAEDSIEQSWISVHRAHIAAEQGNIEEAQCLAQRGFAQVALVASDVTGSSVRAAAAWAMFNTANVIRTDLGPVVSALDNPTSWWRSQKTAAGLESAAKEHFREWSHDPSVTFGDEYASHNALHSATIQAKLAGSFEQAKNIASLRAQINLSIPDGSALRTIDALETLRSAGDEKRLGLAINEVARREPLKQLRELVSHVSPEGMTRTTSRADLRVLQSAGIYAEPAHAHRLVAFLQDALEHPQVFAEQVAARYLVTPALLEALAGRRDFMQDGQWAKFVEYVLTREHDQVSGSSLAKLLTEASVNDTDRLRLARTLDDAPDWLQPALRQAIGADRETDRAQARQQLLAGNLDGLSFIRGNLGELATDEAAAVTATLASAVDAERLRPMPLGLVVQERDDAANLAKLCINFPDLGGWDSLVLFIAAPTIQGHRKRQAALTIARNSHAVPDSVRTSMLSAARSARTQIDDPSPVPTLVADVGGAIDCLYASLLDTNEPDRLAVTASLLAGSRQHRCDLALYLDATDEGWLLLAALVRDLDPQVSSNAAAGLARLVRRSSDPAPAIMDLLVQLVEEDTAIAHPIAVGLGGPDPLHRDLRYLAAALRSHTSIRVRKLGDALPVCDP